MFADHVAFGAFTEPLPRPVTYNNCHLMPRSEGRLTLSCLLNALVPCQVERQCDSGVDESTWMAPMGHPKWSKTKAYNSALYLPLEKPCSYCFILHDSHSSATENHPNCGQFGKLFEMVLMKSYIWINIVILKQISDLNSTSVLEVWVDQECLSFSKDGPTATTGRLLFMTTNNRGSIF